MKIKDYLDKMRIAIEDLKAHNEYRFHEALSISPEEIRASLKHISNSKDRFILDIRTDEHGNHTLLLSEDTTHTAMSKALQLSTSKE